MNILLCAVPRYGAYMMQLTGLLLLFANLLYVCLIPSKPLRIPFEGATLTFNYGYCFWMVFSAGKLMRSSLACMASLHLIMLVRNYSRSDRSCSVHCGHSVS